MKNPEVMRGINECLVRLEPDHLRRVSASAQVTYAIAYLFGIIYNLPENSNAFAAQISDFVSAKADFGTELAISTRTELDPGDRIRLCACEVCLFASLRW